MKKIKYILSSLAFLSLGACSVEAPFQANGTGGEGQFRKSALDLDVNESALNVSTRADNYDIVKKFGIVFQTYGSQNPVTVKSFETYESMPEVVTLDVGKYIVVATYGEDHPAKFESPYYRGESEAFAINANEITTEIDPVKCNLANVKVTINFHKSLLDHMSDDSYIEVYVNPDESLKFYKGENRAGYFKHSDVCTLTATFHGTLDGVEVHEGKAMDGIQQGCHYDLTFIRHDYNNEESGDLNGMVTVDAAVTVVDLNRNVTILDDGLLSDEERPKEDNQGGEDPGEDPTYPDTPVEPGTGPVFAMDPSSTVELEKVCDVNENSVVILNIHSDAGIDKFLVRIESEDLTELIGGDGTLNLVEPGDMLEFLQGVQLLKDGKVTLKGEKDVSFDVTGFMPMLMLVEGTHKFVITVGDANGEKTVNLILNVPVKE